MRSKRGRLVAAIIAVTTSGLTLSCGINDYCLNCALPGDGGGPVDDGDLDGPADAGDGSTCVVTGPEVCDNMDNDCDGTTDEGPLPQVGDPCPEQRGECAGGVLQCTTGAISCNKPPMAESCDNLDNNCNGIVDEGDPGGGSKCGTDAGECVAGVNRCTNGAVVCVGAIGTVGGQPETCNGRDDDCDNLFDEGLTNLGACPAGGSSVGLCTLGTLMCMGGGTVCVGAVGPTFELCDALDQDCDGNPTNGYDLFTDPRNCGACGSVCNLPNTFEGCAGGICTIAACQPSYFNNDGTVANGCEFGPCTPQGNEVCNGVDDDCNGFVDDNLGAPPAICLTGGECGAPAPTAACMGVMGWRCTYPGMVSTDANGNIVPETRCDNRDNDCDSRVDENQPNKGTTCSDGGIGLCQGTGTFQCDPVALDGPAVCTISSPGSSATPEICDGRDNDCDGFVDDGAETGSLPGQDWVPIDGGRQIMKYEASKPDASATSIGIATARTCSKPGVLPWTNVTYPQAVAACQSIGARLCSESEWHRTCSNVAAPTFPLNVPAGAFQTTWEAETYSGIAFNTDTGVTPNVLHAWTPSYPPGFFSVSAMQAEPNSGSNVTTAANAVTRSPRLDYAIDVAAAGNYRVCARLYAASNTEDSVWMGISPTAPGTAGNLRSLTVPSLGAWRWTGPTSTIAVAAGANIVSVYMQEDGMRVDRIHLTTAAACPTDANPPAGSEGNRWAYQASPNTYQPATCNGEDLDTNPGLVGDQDDILVSGSPLTPMCHANNGANDTFDLSGNVKEWTLARQPGQNPLRGGASNSTAVGISCSLNFTLADDQFYFPNVGFRCCR